MIKSMAESAVVLIKCLFAASLMVGLFLVLPFLLIATLLSLLFPDATHVIAAAVEVVTVIFMALWALMTTYFLMREGENE